MDLRASPMSGREVKEMNNLAEALVFVALVTAAWAAELVSYPGERPEDNRVSRWWVPLFVLRPR